MKKHIILIPAYNAAEHLPELFKRIKKIDKLENVLLINDGSTDQTLEICKKHNIETINLSNNQGKGSALKKGFKAILEKGDIDFFLTVDADLQHDVDYIPSFIKKMDSSKADIVIGNRLHDKVNMPKSRIFSNTVTSWLVSKLAGQKVIDSQSGYRLIKTDVLKNINLIYDKYEMESELLIKASREEFKIDAVPIPTIYNGEKSSINVFLDTYRFIKMYTGLILFR